MVVDLGMIGVAPQEHIQADLLPWSIPWLSCASSWSTVVHMAHVASVDRARMANCFVAI